MLAQHTAARVRNHLPATFQTPPQPASHNHTVSRQPDRPVRLQYTLAMAPALLSPSNLKALAYGAMNVVSASGIVFANKAVFQTYGFHFTYALTWVHTVFTLVGMRVFASCGMFGVKAIPQRRLVPLAAAYVAYIVLCNLSLKVNTVGFYQVGAPREPGEAVRGAADRKVDQGGWPRETATGTRSGCQGGLPALWVGVLRLARAAANLY